MVRVGVGIVLGLLVAAPPGWARELPPAPAKAAVSKGMVAVVRAADADVPSQEVAMRIIAELMASGVPVVALTCEPGAPTCASIAGERVLATVVVARHDDVPAIEVHPGGSLRRASAVLVGTPAPPVGSYRAGGALAAGEGPGALAVRAVELVRVILLEVSDSVEEPDRGAAASAGTAPPVGQAVSRRAAPPADDDDAVGADRDAPPPEAARLAGRMGALALGSLNGLSTGYGPALSVAHRTARHVGLSLLLAGPAFGTDRFSADGSHVSVRQELVVAGADLVGSLGTRWIVGTGFGVGAYHVQVTGHPTNLVFNAPASVGRSTGGFSTMLTWSVSAVANLRHDVGLFVDGRLFVLTPTPVVLLNGTEIGRAGNPGLLVTAGIELRI